MSDSNLEPGIDFGSYTPNVTVERLRCARERFGIEWASIGLQGNRYLDQQIEACLTAGLKVDTYLIPRSWYLTPQPLVQAQLARIDQYKGQLAAFVWFDVETLPGESPPPDVVLPWTRAALAMIERDGWTPGIYTSASMWDELAGSIEFTRYPLWEALYGRYRVFRTFGGWSKRAGVQWQGSTELCELNVDLNTWETKEQSMQDEQIKALIGEALAYTGRVDAKLAAHGREMLVQGILLATGRDAEAEARIRFEAIAAGVALP